MADQKVGSIGAKKRKKTEDFAPEGNNKKGSDPSEIIGVTFNEEIVDDLRESIQVVGQLQGILICKQHPDHTLGGRHREKALGGRQNVKVEEVDVEALAAKLGVNHETAELAVTIQSNRQRRVSRAETKQLVLQFASNLEQQKTPLIKIPKKLQTALGFSHEYIDSLLPSKYKNRHKANSPGRPRKKKEEESTILTSATPIHSEKQNETRAPGELHTKLAKDSPDLGVSESTAADLHCVRCSKPITGKVILLDDLCYRSLTSPLPDVPVP